MFRFSMYAILIQMYNDIYDTKTEYNWNYLKLKIRFLLKFLSDVNNKTPYPKIFLSKIYYQLCPIPLHL